MNNSTDIIVKTEFLRNYLIKNNLTESQFAEIIGVAHSTVNRIFNGKRNPGSKFIAGVLKNFSDLSFDAAFTYDYDLPKGKNNDKTA